MKEGKEDRGLKGRKGFRQEREYTFFIKKKGGKKEVVLGNG